MDIAYIVTGLFDLDKKSLVDIVDAGSVIVSRTQGQLVFVSPLGNSLQGRVCISYVCEDSLV